MRVGLAGGGVPPTKTGKVTGLHLLVPLRSHVRVLGTNPATVAVVPRKERTPLRCVGTRIMLVVQTVPREKTC